MFSSLRLISLAPGLSPAARSDTARALQAALAPEGAAAGTLLQPTGAGSWNGGDFIWRREYRDEAAYRAAESHDNFRRGAGALLADRSRIGTVEHVAYGRGEAGGVSPAGGLYRIALFCANRNPDPQRLARFRDETVAMPRRVHAIRRWQLATPVTAGGSRPWTHVWEQEYDDLAGLTGPYMLHPCHWGEVDRWFDPEEPDWLVDPLLCHAFCATSAPVIGVGAG